MNLYNLYGKMLFINLFYSKYKIVRKTFNMYLYNLYDKKFHTQILVN